MTRFEDLTPFDLTYFTSLAVDRFRDTNFKDRVHLIVEVFTDFKKARDLVVLSPLIQEKLRLNLQGGPFEGKHTLSFEASLKECFTYVEINFPELVSDNTLEMTWPIPKPSWYHKVETYKREWMF